MRSEKQKAAFAAMRAKLPTGRWPNRRNDPAMDRAYKADWVSKNRAKRRATLKRYKAKNREKIKEWAREYTRRRYAPLAVPTHACPDTCEICGRAPTGKKKTLCLEHDHKTGFFRGWVCDGCNRAMGHAADSPSRLRAMADYLERFL